MMVKYFTRHSYRLVMAFSIFVSFMFLLTFKAQADDVEIGKKDIDGGIELVFKASKGENIVPVSSNLAADEAEAHIELWANFEENNVYASAADGFVPYLNVNVFINNRVTGESLQITLTPNVDGNNGFHYARNVDLPGDPVSDSYDLTFFVEPPGEFVVQIHSDFVTNVDTAIIKEQNEKFDNVNFADLFAGSDS